MKLLLCVPVVLMLFACGGSGGDSGGGQAQQPEAVSFTEFVDETMGIPTSDDGEPRNLDRVEFVYEDDENVTYWLF